MAVVTLARVRPDSTKERPLRKDAQRNRQRIIDAARDLFAQKGLEPSLNDVAHHARVGVGTVYRRFATKESLLEAIFEEGLNELSALAERAALQQDSWQGFAWFVEQMCQLTATDRGLREVAFSKSCAGDRVNSAQERLVPALNKLVERAQADGHLRPEIAAPDMPILGLLAGTVSEFAGAVNTELWRRYVALLIDGLRCRPEQTRLPVDALSEAELDLAMHTWEPAGAPAVTNR
ncbi:TetR/AcrR family transcriptional regulator [Mycolicibacterium vinylchloridicum]|uniref:TetR/AcrR family transcriptional regulator n=1 Tax=Mycolicibacterium vinylchloridicum TaxID=2736928 RepID=UPI0038993CC5